MWQNVKVRNNWLMIYSSSVTKRSFTFSRIKFLVTCRTKPRVSATSFQNSMHSSASSLSNMNLQLIAVAQMTSTADKKENFKICTKLVEEAAEKGAKMVFLPEGCDYIAESKKSSLEMAEPLDGPTIKGYCKLAKSLDMWLSAGGIHIREAGAKKISNTHVIINSAGKVVSSYVKAHLFDVSIPERNIHLQESAYVEAGKHIVNPVPAVCGFVGLGICYDMRFPEFSILQRIMGAQILTFPSAFTVHTGRAHWHTLLRARAIENQCYVVAAAQTGEHNSKRASYGHALVVDPWGSILSEICEGTGIALAEVNLAHLEKVRSEMPVLSHRRTDLYSLENVASADDDRSGLAEIMPFPPNYISYKFGQVMVPGGCIFLKTRLSQAFTNKKPFAPGHVLVTPENPVHRFVDLSQVELMDLAQTVVLTLKVIKDQYASTQGVQIAIQDGSNSGQTINHVHVHLVPQKNAFDSMTVMYEIEEKRKWRDEKDMENEASILRNLVTEMRSQKDQWLDSIDIPSPLLIQGSGSLDLSQSCNGIMTDETPGVSSEKKADNLVFSSEKTNAFLAMKPVLPGHVILNPHKKVDSLVDLTPAEVADLFLCIQIVQEFLEKFFGTFSTTIFIADGTPGSTQLTAHVVPRQKNDLPVSDDIYSLFRNVEKQEFASQEKNYDEDLLVFLKKNIRP